MRARTLMVQGTGSGVGKSFLVTGLCRLFAQAGLRVAPFKAQNMSLNAWVTADGGEMARAQAVQAEAAGVEPSVDMNPVLLKPKGEGVSQVILRGRPAGDRRAGELWAGSEELWTAVVEALERLRQRFDLVVLEGAGSPAELNLRRQDLANMRVAEAADAPVLLVGDIERGGIFASLLGTLDLLPPEERRRVRGLVVNKFRGDLRLFADGVRILEERGGVPVLGVLPRLEVEIEPEDSLDLAERAPGGATAGWEPGRLEIAVVLHPHLSNFSDLEPLRRHPGLRLRAVRRPEELGEPDAILLPGSKNTVDDLRAHRESGLAAAVAARARAGSAVVGICGGLQMMGERLDDPDGVEGEAGGWTGGSLPGLGLLPLETRFLPRKRTRQAEGRVVAPGWEGLPVRGYEIHAGRSRLLEGGRPFALLRPAGAAEREGGDGAASPEEADGAFASPLLWGSYLHGLFENEQLLERWLEELRAARARRAPRRVPAGSRAEAGEAGAGAGSAFGRGWRERQYDALAQALREHLDLELLGSLVGVRLEAGSDR